MSTANCAMRMSASSTPCAASVPRRSRSASMPKILRLPESAATGSAPAADLPLLTQAEFLHDPASRAAGGKKVGVRVAPADRVEDLAPYLGAVAWVAIEFPG